MTIPVDVQARIAAIQSRFAAPSTTSTGSSSTSGTNFASVLDRTLGTGTTSSVTAALGLGGTGSVEVDASDPLVGMAQVLLDASAARSAGLSGRVGAGTAGASTPAVGAVGAAYGSTSSATIASKQAVRNLEGLYDNGRLPDEALTSIGVGSHRLSPPAASAFMKMTAAAEADGVNIGVTDSYRSYDAQVDVARRKGLYSQGGLAAKPGTSDHGLGLALDLDLDSAAQSWMRTNGARFGFVEDTPREPWHWKFDGV